MRGGGSPFLGCQAVQPAGSDLFFASVSVYNRLPSFAGCSFSSMLCSSNRYIYTVLCMVDYIINIGIQRAVDLFVEIVNSSGIIITSCPAEVNAACSFAAENIY